MKKFATFDEFGEILEVFKTRKAAVKQANKTNRRAAFKVYKVRVGRVEIEGYSKVKR